MRLLYIIIIIGLLQTAYADDLNWMIGHNVTYLNAVDGHNHDFDMVDSTIDGICYPVVHVKAVIIDSWPDDNVIPSKWININYIYSIDLDQST